MINGLSVNYVYLATGVTDMRKSINGLSLIVSEQFGHAPFNGSVFVFCNRSRDKLKILYWECNGFWLYYRRLDKGKFKWPAELNEQTVSLSLRELHWLLDGLSYLQTEAHTLSAPDGMIVSRRRREICQSEVRDSARGRLKFYPE